jgi:hypothetical protein
MLSGEANLLKDRNALGAAASAQNLSGGDGAVEPSADFSLAVGVMTVWNWFHS